MTANESAQDLQRAGRLQQAHANLMICVSEKCPGPVREDCVARIADVERAQPTIVFDVKDPAGRDVADIEVTIDGRPFAKRLDGRALAVDPGEHTFRFEMAGRPPTSETLVIKEGEKDRRERVVIGGAQATPGESASAITPTLLAAGSPRGEEGAVPAASPVEPLRDGSSSSGQRIAGVAIGVAGLAALGVGGAFFVVAGSKWSSAQSECGSRAACSNYGQAVIDHDSAATAATISTVGVIAGSALLVGGTVLYLTASSKAPPATGSVGVLPGVWPGGGGMFLWRKF